MAWSNKETLANNAARIHVVSGSFPISTPAVVGTKVWTYTTAKYVTFSYTATGTKALQDAYTIAVTDTAAGAYKKACATTNNDCTLVTSAAIGWSYQILNHGITGGGCKVIVDSGTSLLSIMIEAGVTTMTHLKTAVNLRNSLVFAYGGTKTGVMTAAADLIGVTAMNATANAWPTVRATTSVRVAATVTGSSATVGTIMNIFNEATQPNKKITAVLSGTGAATTDDVTSALSAGALTGAVDAIALNATYKTGADYTVARSGAYGVHEYTVTFTDSFASQGELFSLAVGCRTTTAAAHVGAVVVPGAYSASSKTLVLSLSAGDSSSGGDAIATDANFVPSTNTLMISFMAEFRLKN